MWNMRNRRKAVCVKFLPVGLAVFVLLVSVLTGCGKKEDGKETLADDPAGQTQSLASGEGREESSAENPDAPFGVSDLGMIPEDLMNMDLDVPDESTGMPSPSPDPSVTSEPQEDTAAVTLGLEERALEIARGMAAAAGKDYQAFSDLFADTPDERIQTYYNVTYKDLDAFEHEQTLVLTSDDRYARVTVLFYTIPEDYPGTKEDTFTLTLLLGKGEDGVWRVEENDVSMDETSDAYFQAIFTGDGYEAYRNGMIVVRQWLYFNPDYVFTFEGAFSAKVIEFFPDGEGNAHVSLYFANGTDRTVNVASVDRLQISDAAGNVLMDVGCDIGIQVAPGEASVYSLYVPEEYLGTCDWSSAKARVFESSWN